MRKRTDRNLIMRITAIIFIFISAAFMKHYSLYAQTGSENSIISEEKTPGNGDIKPAEEKSDVSGTSKENSATTTDPANGGDNEKKELIKEEQIFIKAGEISSHPEIILNSYKEAYPELINDVVKINNDWVVKFKSGNIYYWADGKILPESLLAESDKYIRYSIYAYNVNGRSPESYTDEEIEKLRVKKLPLRKKVDCPCEERGLYKELYAISNKRNAVKQLSEVKLSGHYISVHRTIAEKIKSIDLKIKQLAGTDPEVRVYLKNIRSIESFNWRNIAGTSRRSTHSYGIAIDILPKKYHKKTIYWGWEQEKNSDWMLVPQSKLWAPPVSVIKIFFEEGFIWGGHWDRYDTMHFEYRPELIALSKNVKFD